MPKQNTPREAVERYVTPFRDAIHCIAHGTLITSQERVYRINEVYSLILNNSDPVQLRSSPAISLSAGQRFRIVRDDDLERGPYRVHTVEYWYLSAADDDREMLTFHWTPEAVGRGQKTYPHMHVGPALLAADSPIFPTTFHKKHVPSGRISIESVARFAIEELSVSPLKLDWSDILDHRQGEFDQYRRTK